MTYTHESPAKTGSEGDHSVQSSELVMTSEQGNGDQIRAGRKGYSGHSVWTLRWG